MLDTMQPHEKEKIEQIIALRKRSGAFYAKNSPVYRAFTGM